MAPITIMVKKGVFPLREFVVSYQEGEGSKTFLYSSSDSKMDAINAAKELARKFRNKGDHGIMLQIFGCGPANNGTFFFGFNGKFYRRK